MAKTAQMSLMELMVLKEDISNVLLYLGKSGNFQFQSWSINISSVLSFMRSKTGFVSRSRINALKKRLRFVIYTFSS